MKKILTGLRANGDFHLGNYLGSMQSMAALQASLEPGDSLNMFIADLHSFTTPIDHSSLHEKVMQNVRMYIAAGVDPENQQTLLYRQSKVPQHTQLAWALSCFSGFGELSRMVEFKDKAAKLGDKSVGVGLFSYPVLMAADILLYDAEYIPLGADQKQHMELTRTLATRMNHKFGDDLFTVPYPWEKQLAVTDRDDSIRIRSLQNPQAKMSKSITDPKGTIGMLDDPEAAKKKIMSAETDSIGEINYDWQAQPGIANLLQILALLSSRPIDEVAREWQGQTRYGDLKKAVAEVVAEFLEAFQAKYAGIDETYVEDILCKHEAKAKEQAEVKITQVYAALGLN